MNRRPFEYQSYNSWWKLAREDEQAIDLDQGLVFAVEGMEMRRIVIVNKHLDHYAKKSGYLRHEVSWFSSLERGLQASYQ